MIDTVPLTDALKDTGSQRSMRDVGRRPDDSSVGCIYPPTSIECSPVLVSSALIVNMALTSLEDPIPSRMNEYTSYKAVHESQPLPVTCGNRSGLDMSPDLYE